MAFKAQYWAIPRKPRSNQEAQTLYNHIRTIAFFLDAISDSIPGLDQLPFEIGFDAIIGAFLPVVGDWIGLVLGLYQVFLSWMFGIPWTTLGLMLLNVVLDAVIGIVPWFGDVFSWPPS